MPIKAKENLEEISDEMLASEIRRAREWLDSHSPRHPDYNDYRGYQIQLEIEQNSRRTRAFIEGLESSSSTPLEDAFRLPQPLHFEPRTRPDRRIELDLSTAPPRRPEVRPPAVQEQALSLRDLPALPNNFADFIRPVDQLPPLGWLPWGLGPSVLEGLWEGFKEFPEELDPFIVPYESRDGLSTAETIRLRISRPPAYWPPQANPDLWAVYTFPRTIHGNDWEDAFKEFGQELGQTIWKEGLWPRLKPNVLSLANRNPLLTTLVGITAVGGLSGYIVYQYGQEEIDLGLGVIDFKYDLEDELIDFGFNFSVIGLDIEAESEGWDVTRLQTIRGRDFRSSRNLGRLWRRIEPMDLRVQLRYKRRF